ncbi:MAG: hypothetical protein NTU44_13380 [Bacteroidetes bacterium]|nr:hypothetical protein [Bacteroidota bacterium]
MTNLAGLMGQVAISYYPFQSVLAISTNTEKVLWIDYRIETNTFFTNLNMEISPMWNISRTELVNYYLGPGISFNPAYMEDQNSIINGYFADLGIRIKPLKTDRRWQLVLELSPYLNREGNGGNLRSKTGISYNLARNKQ